ncbi:C40 family peptidase [Kurthia huakuii]|uniref:C40 family peptidase n=1 Tax=Kurthia huakuii TaxID=1421019 RepID=UPI0004966EB3|nr:SH3 domain-containing C40 family peptidase [Kurthia huakuii]MBM7700667.1 cell wall-associated NlpC family hydrolase [Kurthia huakuii]
MKKILATTMAAAVGLGTVTSIDLTTASAATSKATKVSGTYVTTETKSVYHRASTKKIGKVSKNTKIKLTHKRTVNGKTWYKISYNGGKLGWIVGANIKRLTVSSASTYKKTFVTKKAKNYYNLAGGHNKRLGTLSSGKKIKTSAYRTVNGKGWVKVNGYGWTPKSNLKSYVSQTGNSSSFDSLSAYGAKFLGVPYVWGGSTPSGFDCSGFTSYVYKHAAGKTIPRTSAAQYVASKKISKSQLKKGDLVFFNTSGRGVSHVSIYAGNNKLIHAAGKSVKYSNLYDGYWDKRIVGYGTYR